MKPRVFVASSVEGVGVAFAVQEALEYDAEGTVWSQGVFTPSAYPLESIEEELGRTDFGVFVFTPDDVVVLRKEEMKAVRDNVLFELGLFIGRLGRKRNFVLQPRGVDDFRLPTDLTGLTPVTYDGARTDGNLLAAIGPACNKIRDAIKSLGPVVQTVDQIVAELDEKGLAVMSAFGSVAYFGRPPQGQFDGQVFDQGVSRLRTLKCLRFDVSGDGRLYAYHWTDIGKVVVAKFGHDTPKARITPPSHASATSTGPQLSTEATELLGEACRDPNGVVMMSRSMRGLSVKTNNTDFIPDNDARASAKWKAAVEELVAAGCLEHRGAKGEVFGVTANGFKVNDEVAK